MAIWIHIYRGTERQYWTISTQWPCLFWLCKCLWRPTSHGKGSMFEVWWELAWTLTASHYPSGLTCLLFITSSPPTALQFEANLSSLISKVPLKECPPQMAVVRTNGDNVRKTLQRRPERNKCLRNICFMDKHTYGFSFLWSYYRGATSGKAN